MPLQLKQLPLDGPEVSPGRHAPVSPHQPQPNVPAQLPQSVPVQDGAHSKLKKSQFPQEPVVGPSESPGRHAPVSAHHPQPERPAQAPHSVSRKQVSGVPPSHAVATQLQSPHEAPSGPLDDPSWQVPVSPHQPQG